VDPTEPLSRPGRYHSAMSEFTKLLEELGDRVDSAKEYL
jgi:hypothetical protein